jgi:hypothetical protein
VKPDFSGEYELDRQASRLSAAASDIDGATLRIEHREPVFRCSGKFVAGGATVLEYTFELKADGASASAGGDERARLFWDDEVLVNEFRTGTPDPVFTMTWRYELFDGGRRLRASEQIRGSGRDQDNVWEFARAETPVITSTTPR